jgi:hypothetical protein
MPSKIQPQLIVSDFSHGSKPIDKTPKLNVVTVATGGWLAPPPRNLNKSGGLRRKLSDECLVIKLAAGQQLPNRSPSPKNTDSSSAKMKNDPAVKSGSQNPATASSKRSDDQDVNKSDYDDYFKDCDNELSLQMSRYGKS